MNVVISKRRTQAINRRAIGQLPPLGLTLALRKIILELSLNILIVPKLFPNLSKIDLGGGMDATWEPPLCRGDPKTSFLTILAPFLDPIWGPVWVYLCAYFFDVFLYMVCGWRFCRFGVHVVSILGPFLGPG